MPPIKAQIPEIAPAQPVLLLLLSIIFSPYNGGFSLNGVLVTFESLDKGYLSA